jgi:hypothetical protein
MFCLQLNQNRTEKQNRFCPDLKNRYTTTIYNKLVHSVHAPIINLVPIDIIFISPIHVSFKRISSIQCLCSPKPEWQPPDHSSTPATSFTVNRRNKINETYYVQLKQINKKESVRKNGPGIIIPSASARPEFLGGRLLAARAPGWASSQDARAPGSWRRSRVGRRCGSCARPARLPGGRALESWRELGSAQAAQSSVLPGGEVRSWLARPAQAAAEACSMVAG